jgi:hypothetical protein
MGKKTYSVYDQPEYLKGPFALTESRISRLSDEVFGVYVLIDDCSNHRDHRLAVYVGRGVVRTRLLRHWESLNAPRYFAYAKLDSQEDAFYAECELFHRYGKALHLKNRVHPARPAGRDDLPLCSQQGCNGEA